MGFLEGIKRFLPMTGNQIHFLISPFGLGLLSSSLALTFGASHVAWKLRNAIGDFLLDPEEIQRAKEKRERVLRFSFSEKSIKKEREEKQRRETKKRKKRRERTHLPKKNTKISFQNSFLTQMKDQTIEMRDAKTARKIHGSLKMYTPLKPTQKSVLVSIMSGVVTSALVFPIRTVVVRAVKDDKIFVWNLFKDMWATGQSPSWLYDGFLWSMAATFTALCVQQVFFSQNFLFLNFLLTCFLSLVFFFYRFQIKRCTTPMTSLTTSQPLKRTSQKKLWYNTILNQLQKESFCLLFYLVSQPF